MNVKKFLAVILAVIMIVGVMPTMVFAADVAVTEIATVEDLKNFAEAVNGGKTFAGEKVILTADIDLTDIQWDPIGGDSVYFAGEFDGNGKTISNLTNTENVARKGLFGLVEKCYIHDLTLKDVNFSGQTTGARIGALAGNLQYYNVIENVVVDGLTYTITDTDGLIGGLVGYSWTSYVKDCEVNNATMNITSSDGSAVGGMIAYGRGVGDARANFPYADKIAAEDYQGESVWNYVDSTVTNLTANLSGTLDFGGFLGADTYNHWRNYAKNNTVTGLTVACAEGDGVYTVGGFMGGQYGGYDPAALSNNSVTGTITSKGTNTASTFGGFIGYKGGRPGGVTACSANVDITVAAGDVGGFVAETQQYFTHAYSFDGCEAKGDVSTDNGTAGGFVANVQHGGDGSGLNVSITNSSATGNATGSVAGSFVANVNDTKNNNPTGGMIIIDGNTASGTVTGTTTVDGQYPTSKHDTLYIGKAPTAMIGTTVYNSLAEAIAAAQNGDTIVLAGETHTMPAISEAKELTITGYANTVIELANPNYEGGVGTSNSTLTFEGVTVKFNENTYRGFKHTAKLTYTNCTIEGIQFLYAPEVTFTNCTFNVTGDAYAVWTYGASKVDFTNCTFNTDGKAVLVYTEAAHTATINVNGCTFNATTNREKAAVEVGQSAYGNEATYTLNINDTTADSNFVANKSISNLFGNKNDMDLEDLVVTIDGKRVLDRGIIVTTDKEKCVYGDTVQVTVTLNGKDIAGAEWTLTYDPDMFELVSGEAKGVKFATGEDVFAATEELGTYTFKVIAEIQDTAMSEFAVTNAKAQTRDEAVMNIVPEVSVTPVNVEVSAPYYEVEVGENDYVAGKKLVLVHTKETSISFSYAGETMYDVTAKYGKVGYSKTFALVVDALAETVVIDDYKAKVSIVYADIDDAYVISYNKAEPNYDLNGSEAVELGDVIVAFGVYNAYDNYFENYMKVVLNADVNADGIVDVNDTGAFVTAYNKANSPAK